MNNGQESNLSQEQIDSLILLYSSGQIEEALNRLESLKKINPKDAVLFNISGACYAKLGEPIIAIKQYDLAIAIDPKYSEAYSNLGITLQGLGELENALKYFEKAFAL